MDFVIKACNLGPFKVERIGQRFYYSLDVLVQVGAFNGIPKFRANFGQLAGRLS